MSYMVRIVQADGVARYLRAGRLRDIDGYKYPDITGARRAARKYIGDGKHLGQYYADIVDDRDHERHIEVNP